MSRGNFDEKTPLLTSSHHMQGSNAGLDGGIIFCIFILHCFLKPKGYLYVI